jgi:hypothetical protein
VVIPGPGAVEICTNFGRTDEPHTALFCMEDFVIGGLTKPRNH